MTKELVTFDYGQLDGKIADFLRMKERNMREIVGRAYTELGRELKEAQDTLRRQGSKDGVFMAWYQSIGYKKDAVSRLINRYELFAKCEEQEQQLLDDLPVTLTYEIAAPSAEKSEPKRQAKAAVMAGDVKTLKEYREMVAKLEAAEQQAAELSEQNVTLRDTIESLSSAPPPLPKIEVQREYVADPEMAARLKRYEAKYGDIDGEVTQRISNHVEVDGAAAHFADDVQRLLLDYAHLTTYKSTFSGISDGAYEEYRTTLDALKDFVDGMERVMSATPKGKAVIIDITNYKESV